MITANLNEKIINEIRKKAEEQFDKMSFAYYEKNKDCIMCENDLTTKDLLKIKTIYTKKELDFVIDNYNIRATSHQFLNNCIYLLDEYKKTKQISKCDAIYTILNKYFTIINCYDDPYNDHPLWEGFDICQYIKCPTILQDLINDKVVAMKAEKNKKARIKYKEKADKTDKEIIEELEL